MIEGNVIPKVTVLGEPQLGRRGLYAHTNVKSNDNRTIRQMRDVISYCDGGHSLLDIAGILEVPFSVVSEICDTLLDHGLIEVCEGPPL